MNINYNDLVFRSVSNTENGETSYDTVFYYKQIGRIVTATYSGGNILAGNLVGIVSEGGSLNFRYNQVNDQNQLRSGMCSSKPEILADGRIRLYEKWQWTVDEHSEGESILEEVRD